jgi:hypothetical protein
MKGHLSFKVINPDYDQEYANEYHEGEESESNWKYLWAKEYLIEDVDSVELIEDGNFRLKGKYKDGGTIDINIPHVVIFRFFKTDGITVDFAVSKSILNKTHQVTNEKFKVIRCYFYINSSPESTELSDSLIINIDEIPEQLRIK